MEVYKNHICTSLRKIYSSPKEEKLSNTTSDASEQKLPKENGEDEDLAEFLSEFECPICFEIMESPKRIYACSNNHFICSLCIFDTKMKDCPSCRESFNITKPLIQHTAERMLERLLQKRQKWNLQNWINSLTKITLILSTSVYIAFEELKGFWIYQKVAFFIDVFHSWCFQNKLWNCLGLVQNRCC